MQLGISKGLGTSSVEERELDPKYWVAERASDKKLVGFLAVSPEWSDWWACCYWWVISVFVSAESRRSGIATSLFAALRSDAKAANVQTVNLRVEKENAGAQQFYKRIGFAEDPSHIVMSQGRKPDGKEVGGAAEDTEAEAFPQCGSAGRTLPKGSFKNHFAEIIGNAAVLALAASALAFAFGSCSAVVDVGTVGSCVVAFTLGQAIACGAGAVLVLGWIFVTLKSPVIEEGHNDPTISDVDDTTDVFGAVLASLPSLSGKTVAVTGCTSGIGLQVAIAAVRLGCAEVILLNRPSARARDAEKGLRSLAEKVWATNAADPKAKKPNHGKKTAVRTVPCNLLSFESVKQAAGAVAAAVGPLGGLDVLCCNAGIYCGEDLRTPDGFDITAAVSHLGHFLLTRELLPSLSRAAKMRGQSRVVQHHSGARNGVRLDEDSNPARAFSGHYEPERYLAASQPGTLGGDGPNARFPRYRQAKLSQALFAMELDRRLRACGIKGKSRIKSLSAEPGLVKTNLGVNFLSTFPALSPFRVLIPLLFPLPEAQPVSHGAVPLVRACFDPAAQSGDLWMHQSWVRGKTPEGLASKARPVRVVEAGSPNKTVETVRHEDEYPHELLALDEGFGKRMWATSEAATGKFDVKDLLR